MKHRQRGRNDLLQLMSGFSVGEHVVDEMLRRLGQRVWVAGEQTETVDDLLYVAQLRQN